MLGNSALLELECGSEVWEAMRGSFQGLYTGVPGVWRILVAAYCIIYSNRLSKNSKVVHWMVK
jgi:hypothetical protein